MHTGLRKQRDKREQSCYELIAVVIFIDDVADSILPFRGVNHAATLHYTRYTRYTALAIFISLGIRNI